jgi:hypothetical protein
VCVADRDSVLFCSAIRYAVLSYSVFFSAVLFSPILFEFGSPRHSFVISIYRSAQEGSEDLLTCFPC